MFIVNHTKIFIGISVLLMLASVALIAIYGVRFGVDFTGGSLLEIEYSTVSATSTQEPATSPRPGIQEIKIALVEVAPEAEGAIVQPTGETGYIIRTKLLSSENHTQVLKTLSFGGKWNVTEKRFDSVGPIVGDELQRKAWVALGAVILAIVIFIAFAFRKVSEPVPSWQYGVITLISLLHDILIPAGAIALLGRYYGAEIDVLFVTALLTILGFSVHDTIVVFDRVRENLKLKNFKTFRETVGHSLEQTFMRSINTSLTVVLVLVALLLLGPSSIFMFSLVLLVGIIAGTYSSIFLASPLLLISEKMRGKGK